VVVTLREQFSSFGLVSPPPHEGQIRLEPFSISTTAFQMNDVLVPSINFSMVIPGVFRSGYPTKKNFEFLKSLNLRTICLLVPEEYAEGNKAFCADNGVQVLNFAMAGNKEPFVDIPEEVVHQALSSICDTRNQPLLIHCNKGKHRTGAIVGCLRKLQGWSLASIFEEYNRFAGDKGRLGDQQFIELYRPKLKLDLRFKSPWLALQECGVEVESYEGPPLPAPKPALLDEKKEKKDKKDKKEKKAADEDAPAKNADDE
jgi:tyrosine-protein phosphatase SIW14